MNSKIQIVNQALVQLGECPISDMSDGTKYALIASTFWAGAVAAVLRGHPWNFASRRQMLAKLDAAPPFGFGAAFQLPADCLRVLEASADSYKIEGRQILCDETTLTLRYVSGSVAVAEWDAIFCEALSIFLAWKMAYPVTKSEAVRDACWQCYVQILAQGRAVDAQEEPADDFGYSDMIGVRG
jgi:hypothetical protein